MKPSILFFSALASMVAPWLHAGAEAVQGVDKTAAETPSFVLTQPFHLLR